MALQFLVDVNHMLGVANRPKASVGAFAMLAIQAITNAKGKDLDPHAVKVLPSAKDSAPISLLDNLLCKSGASESTRCRWLSR